MFGEERLQELVRGGGTGVTVITAVRNWRGEAMEDADDLTIVVVDVR
jgi:hypothetical protein